MHTNEDHPASLLAVRLAGPFRGHDWEASLWVSPDGRRLLSTASSYFGHSILLWDTLEQKRLRALEEHQDQVLECAYADDSRSFATACEDGIVRVWTADGNLLMALSGHTNGARGVAFVSSSLLLTCDNLGIVRLWDLSTGQVLLAQLGSPDPEEPAEHPASPPLHPMTYAPEQGLLAINHPSARGDVHLWSLDREQLRLHWLGASFRSDCDHFAFSPDGRMLILLEEDFLRVCIGPRFERETLITPPSSWGFSFGLIQCSFSPEGHYLAIGDYDGAVGIWDLWRQGPIGAFRAYLSLRRKSAPFPTLTAVDWSRSGVLATAGFDPPDERYAMQNNFVATLWRVEIGEGRGVKH